MTTDTASVASAETCSLGAYIVAKDPAMRPGGRIAPIPGRGLALMEISCLDYFELLKEILHAEAPGLVSQIDAVDGSQLGTVQLLGLKRENMDRFRLMRDTSAPISAIWDPESARWVIGAISELRRCALLLRFALPGQDLEAKIAELRRRRAMVQLAPDVAPSARIVSDLQPVAHVSTSNASATTPAEGSDPVISLPAGLVLDPSRFAVKLGSREKIFAGKTHEQYALLRILAGNRWRCVPQDRLQEVDAPWHKAFISDEAVESAVKRLRASLSKPFPRLAKSIHTRRIHGRVHVILEWPPKSGAPRKRGASRAKPK